MNTTPRLHSAAGLAFACLAFSPAVSAAGSAKQVSITPPPTHLASYGKDSPNAANLPNPKDVSVYEYYNAAGFGKPDSNSPYANTVITMKLYNAAIATFLANQYDKAANYFRLSIISASYALKGESEVKHPDWHTMNDLLDFLVNIINAPAECEPTPAPDYLGEFYFNMSTLLFNAYFSMDKQPEGKEATAKCLKTCVLFLRKAASLGNHEAIKTIMELGS